eukprot:TRINITY_DN33991_c0_g1_i1.p1 TRINITY_DN33991_c0_g1~~TRINITY_DN33991_c0_g1_i1.p1  ORF type:complete len:681 (+),score=89.49 TRINITY_DN33991_c0_g1_i1:28-2070(+)
MYTSDSRDVPLAAPIRVSNAPVPSDKLARLQSPRLPSPRNQSPTRSILSPPYPAPQSTRPLSPPIYSPPIIVRSVAAPPLQEHFMQIFHPLEPYTQPAPRRRPGLRASLVIGALAIITVAEDEVLQIREDKKRGTELQKLYATINELKKEVANMKEKPSLLSGVTSYMTSFFTSKPQQREQQNVDVLKQQIELLYREVDKRSAEAFELRSALYDYTRSIDRYKDTVEWEHTTSPNRHIQEVSIAEQHDTLSEQVDFQDCEEYEESNCQDRTHASPSGLSQNNTLPPSSPVYSAALPLTAPKAPLQSPQVPIPTQVPLPVPVPPQAPAPAAPLQVPHTPIYATEYTPPPPQYCPTVVLSVTTPSSPPDTPKAPIITPRGRLSDESSVPSPKAHALVPAWRSDDFEDVSGVLMSQYSYILFFNEGAHLDIYLWHGRYTTQDAKLATSLKAEQLDKTVEQSTWHVVQEGAEPARLLALLMMSGQRMVTRMSTERPYLMKLLPVGVYVKVVEVERSKACLETQSVLLLHVHRTAYVWQGRASSVWLRTAALQEVAFGSDVVIVENEGAESSDFLTLLSENNCLSFHKHFEEEQQREREILCVPRMHRWVDNQWQESPISKDTLCSDDYMVTCAKGTFLILTELSSKAKFLQRASHASMLLPVTIFRHAQREHCDYLFDTLGVCT